MMTENPIKQDLQNAGFKPADAQGKLWFVPDRTLIQCVQTVQRRDHNQAKGKTVREYARHLKEAK